VRGAYYPVAGVAWVEVFPHGPVAIIGARMRKIGVVFATMPGMLSYKKEVRMVTRSGVFLEEIIGMGGTFLCASEWGTPPGRRPLPGFSLASDRNATPLEG
jgi:hypothetical protein